MNKSRGTIVVRLSFNSHEFDLKHVYDQLVQADTEPARRHILKSLLVRSLAGASQTLAPAPSQRFGPRHSNTASETVAKPLEPANSPLPAHAIEGEREPVMVTLEPKKGFVYTGSSMYTKDQLY